MKNMTKSRLSGRPRDRWARAVLLLATATAFAGVARAGDGPSEAFSRTRALSSVHDLISFYERMVDLHMPLATPAPGEPMWISGNPELVVMDPNASGWPTAFISALEAQPAHGVATYPVIVEQDDQYRYVYNAHDELLATVPLPEGYDRYALLRERYPQLFNTRFRSESADWLSGVYDAQRMILRVTLVTPEGYADWKAAVDAGAEAEQLANAGHPAMLMESQDFAVTEHRFANNELILGWNPDDPANYHVVERTLDLIGSLWTPVHWAQGTTNWTQAVSSNEAVHAAYRVREFDAAYADSDGTGSGLTALQAYLLGTDPTRRDTSGDGIPDGAVVLAGGDPLHNSLDDAALTLSYEYDEYDRLVAVLSDSHTLTLSHDDAGNVSALSVQGGGQ